MDWIFFAAIDVIFVHAIDLHARILGVNLAFNEGLENFWHPDEEADLIASRGDFEGEMLLYTSAILEFSRITQNAVQRHKHLLSTELVLVVVLWNFEHQKHAIDIENLHAIELAVITDS